MSGVVDRILMSGFGRRMMMVREVGVAMGVWVPGLEEVLRLLHGWVRDLSPGRTISARRLGDVGRGCDGRWGQGAPGGNTRFRCGRGGRTRGLTAAAIVGVLPRSGVVLPGVPAHIGAVA